MGLQLTGGAASADVTKLPIDYSMPSADAATAPAITIRQTNAVDDNSAEPFRFMFGPIISALKTLWFNEGGNPRFKSYDDDQVAVKEFPHSASQTADMHQWFGLDLSTIVTRITSSGSIKGPGLYRAIQSSAPDTTGWQVNEMWLDTSTET